MHRTLIAIGVMLLGGTSIAHAKVVTEEVSYKAGDVTMKGYLAHDDAKKGKRPGVLVVHEWWGHTDYARRRARMLAELGYTALAIDMYGDGKTAGHPKEAGKFMNQVLSNLDAAQARFDAALKLLREHPTTNPRRSAAIGYCFGGGVVLEMARRGLNLRGVASFHGGLKSKQPAKRGKIKARILVLHGAADPFVPAEQVKAFKAEMKKARAKMKFIAYPGAKHAFTNPGADELGKKFKLPLAYDKKADEQSWAALKRFLKQIF